MSTNAPRQPNQRAQESGDRRRVRETKPLRRRLPFKEGDRPLCQKGRCAERVEPQRRTDEKPSDATCSLGPRNSQKGRGDRRLYATPQRNRAQRGRPVRGPGNSSLPRFFEPHPRYPSIRGNARARHRHPVAVAIRDGRTRAGAKLQVQADIIAGATRPPPRSRPTRSRSTRQAARLRRDSTARPTTSCGLEFPITRNVSRCATLITRPIARRHLRRDAVSSRRAISRRGDVAFDLPPRAPNPDSESNGIGAKGIARATRLRRTRPKTAKATGSPPSPWPEEGQRVSINPW